MKHRGLWADVGGHVDCPAGDARHGALSWPGSGTPPSRRTVYASLERGIIPTIRNRTECRSWGNYDGEAVTAVPSLMVAILVYRASVTTSKIGQAAIARAACWSR